MSKYAILKTDKQKNMVQMMVWVYQSLVLIPILLMIQYNAPIWALTSITLICVVYVSIMEIAKKMMFGEMKDSFYTKYFLSRKMYEGMLDMFTKKGFDMSYYYNEIKKDMFKVK